MKGMLTGLAMAAALAAPARSDISEHAFVDTFDTSPLVGWSVANYRFSHPSFDTDWSRDRIAVKDGAALSLAPQSGAENPFSGASVRRLQKTHYGRYEVVMQPARGDGVITGFFTYTGAYYGTRHDEIDIEFLGRDTTQMHAAWFVDGKLRNRFIDLGFDAADRPRLYALEWYPDEIRWYCETKLMLRISADDFALPTTPGHLFFYIWAADPRLAPWSGIAAPDTRAQAMFKAVRFTPMSELHAPRPVDEMALSERRDAATTIETTEFAAHLFAE